jgi:hypothetical protein
MDTIVNAYRKRHNKRLKSQLVLNPERARHLDVDCILRFLLVGLFASCH